MANISRAHRLLQRQHIEVKVEGELVVLKIGSSEMKFDHETAFTISAWLRLRGNEAKRAAGDQRRLMTVLGTLSDAATQ